MVSTVYLQEVSSALILKTVNTAKTYLQSGKLLYDHIFFLSSFLQQIPFSLTVFPVDLFL